MGRLADVLPRRLLKLRAASTAEASIRLPIRSGTFWHAAKDNAPASRATKPASGKNWPRTAALRRPMDRCMAISFWRLRTHMVKTTHSTTAQLTFPAVTERVQSVLREIGVDGLRYEEIIILEYSASIKGLAGKLGEFVPIDELNYLVSRIAELTPEERPKFTAAVSRGEYGDSMQDLINLTYNLGCYEFFPDVRTEEEYGRWLVDHRREFRLPEKARLHFDYESYGEDTCINEGGDFSALGCIYNNRTKFQQVYDGQHVPETYKVFRYPLQAKVRAARSGKGRLLPKAPVRALFSYQISIRS